MEVALGKRAADEQRLDQDVVLSRQRRHGGEDAAPPSSTHLREMRSPGTPYQPASALQVAARCRRPAGLGFALRQESETSRRCRENWTEGHKICAGRRIGAAWALFLGIVIGPCGPFRKMELG